MPDPEADPADVLEQDQTAPGETAVIKAEPVELPMEVSEADALEQHHPVDLDDEDRR